jgi:hypothetical protein
MDNPQSVHRGWMYQSAKVGATSEFAKNQSGATAIEYSLMVAAGIAAALLLDGLGGGPLSR